MDVSKREIRPSELTECLNPHVAHAEIPNWAALHPRYSTSHPAPFLWPRKAIEDGAWPWDPATCGRTR